MENILESYKNKIALAENFYTGTHNGDAMSMTKKLALAKCLQNTDKFLVEKFTAAAGTQRADIGAYKRFVLNLTTLALPSLISFDLVRVEPMSSRAGYITYTEFVAGSEKGDVEVGDVFNNSFELGKIAPDYTSERVTETLTVSSNKVQVSWNPLVLERKVFSGDPESYTVERAFKVFQNNVDITDKVESATEAGEITFKAAESVTGDVRVAYIYNNQIIPQPKLAYLKMRTRGIALAAKARRIAIAYDDLAAFDAKQEYGVDMGDTLAKAAVAELNFEIDTEVVEMLNKSADADEDLVWSKTLPVGVSKKEHYNGFSEIITTAAQKIYDRTRRYHPNYVLVASNVMNILNMMDGFQAAPASTINGPYFAGTVNGIKVYVAPTLEAGRFVFGVNSNDLIATAAVYAPYMPVIPTQLIQMSDGGSTQGFATMYDLKILNKNLLVAGRITA